MFPCSSLDEKFSVKAIVSMLESAAGADQFLPLEFLNSLVDRLQQTQGTKFLSTVFEPVFEEISVRMLATDIFGAYLPPTRVCTELLSENCHFPTECPRNEATDIFRHLFSLSRTKL